MLIFIVLDWVIIISSTHTFKEKRMLRSKAGDINSKTGRKNGGHMPKIHM